LAYAVLLFAACAGRLIDRDLFPGKGTSEVRCSVALMRSCSGAVSVPGLTKAGVYNAKIKPGEELVVPGSLPVPKPQIELAALNEALLTVMGEKVAVDRLLDALRVGNLIAEMRSETGAKIPLEASRQPDAVVSEIRERMERVRALLADTLAAQPKAGADLAEVMGFEHFPPDMGAFGPTDFDIAFSGIPRPLREINFSDADLREAFGIVDAAPNRLAAETGLASRFGLHGEAARSLILHRTRVLVEGAATGTASAESAKKALGKHLALASFQSNALLFMAAQREIARRPGFAFEELIAALSRPAPMAQAGAFMLKLNCVAMSLEDGFAAFAAASPVAGARRPIPGIDFLPGDAADKLLALGPFAAAGLTRVAAQEDHPFRREAADVLGLIRNRWGKENGSDALGMDAGLWRSWRRGARKLL